MPRIIRVAPGTMAYAMQLKRTNPPRMAKRTTGALINSAYERTPTKGGKRRDWSYQPKRTPNTIVRIVPLHMYGQGQPE